MGLFKTLSGLLTSGNTITMTIGKNGDRLLVSLLPGNDMVKGAAKNTITPIQVSGTAEELDEGFVNVIKQGVAEQVGLLDNMKDVEEANKKAAEQAKAAASAKKVEKAAAEDKSKKVADWLELAKKNLNAKKYEDALQVIEKAKAVGDTTSTRAIMDLESLIKNAYGKGTMFQNEDLSDGTEVEL